MSLKIVSENYFKYDNSDYAKSLRMQYGEDGYKKYTTKMNTNKHWQMLPKLKQNGAISIQITKIIY
jgi:hypothetical protein